jgi:uncharacterized membrane protein
MSILVAVRYRVIHYFGLGANSLLTPLFLPDFLLCTVLPVCVVLTCFICSWFSFLHGCMECVRSK